MTEEKLKDGIDKLILLWMPQDPTKTKERNRDLRKETVNQILALIREAGYKSPEEWANLRDGWIQELARLGGKEKR
jgi:FtsZ-binding cell division protein ZapB